MLEQNDKYNLDNYYDDSSQIDNYPSITKTKPPMNYFNTINKEHKQFDYRINKNYFFNKLNSFHYSHEKNKNFFPNRNTYPLKLIKNISYNNNYNTNSNVKNIKDFSFWDKTLSNLSIEKYKQMRDNNIHNTIPNDMDSYRNDFLIGYNNSINDSAKKINFNKANDFYINQKFENNESIDNYDINELKVKKKRNLKNRIRLNKEIANYNILEKKINKEIEKKNRQKFLKAYKKDYYTQNIINFNTDDYKNKKNNLRNEFLLNNIKISNLNTNKKLKRKKENEDDINSLRKKIKRNITFSYNDKDKNEAINYNFIKYLKKDNQKLNHINTIYKQLIDTFFYFINQLSKKYSFKGNIKNINYYLSNSNDLSNILIDLEQHLNKTIKSYEINQKDIEEKRKNIEKGKGSDNEQELLAQSKFITIDIGNKKKNNNKPYTRNLFNSKDFLTKNNKSAVMTKKFVNKTLGNNSLNFTSNINERNTTNNNVMTNKTIKLRKNNGKLMKMLNKINLSLQSNKKNFLNSKIIKRNSNNEVPFSNLSNQSNDLKSILNPIFIKEDN